MGYKYVHTGTRREPDNPGNPTTDSKVLVLNPHLANGDGEVNGPAVSRL